MSAPAKDTLEAALVERLLRWAHEGRERIRKGGDAAEITFRFDEVMEDDGRDYLEVTVAERTIESLEGPIE